ncbi:MAG: DUF1295 domain-containing protein [Hyphomicrobium sp.]
MLVFLAVIGAQGAALSALMGAAWAVQRRTGNSGWIDAVWTFGLGAAGAISALFPFEGNAYLGGSGPSGRQLLVAALVAIWAARLGTHIVQRSAAKADDPRYLDLVRQWGDQAGRQLFVLLQKQALVSLPLALSIYCAAHNTVRPFGLMDGIAIAIFAVSILGEAVADRQLSAFIARPENRGRICDAGLWRYSRHPNYFFEWMHWIAYPVIAIDVTGGYPLGWLALAGPACMYWLLAYVSGVPPLEAHMVRRHGSAYRIYQSRTNAFFPGPLKHV